MAGHLPAAHIFPHCPSPVARPLSGRILDVVTGGVPLGGQGEPDRRDRFLVTGPGAILALGAVLASTPLVNNLLAGQFGDVPKALLGAAIFGGLLARFLYDFLPRRGWLAGTVLTVRGPQWGRQGVRQCDLASAAVVKFGHTMPTMARGIPAPPVLVARQQPGSPPVRLLLRGPDLRPFPAADLRLLAAAIGQRPAPVATQIQKVVQGLYEMADDTEAPKGIVVDWSHRTHRNDQDGPAG